jgi:hypothetical protein
MRDIETRERLHRSTQRALQCTVGAKTPAANQVVVTDDFGHETTFSTITDALNSITNASDENEYIVAAGPGTYAENVVMKPWVHLKGAGATQTIIVGVLLGGPALQGTSNSSVQFCGIQAHGAVESGVVTAVQVMSSTDFTMASCALYADDGGSPSPGTSVYGITVDYPLGADSQVALNYCTIQATSTGDGAQSATGAIVNQGSLLQIFTSKVIAENCPTNIGGVSINAAGLELDWCTVGGSTWALYVDTSGASCVAKDCTIDGGVSPGVQVING